MIIVSDTTPIISLLKAGHLDWLEKAFGKVLIPQAVYFELIANPRFAQEAEEVEKCSYISVVDVRSTDIVDGFQQRNGLDRGESEALALYVEQKADVLLLDEHKARMVAKKSAFRQIGTIGIMMYCFDKKIATRGEIESGLDILLQNGIRYSVRLCNSLMSYIGSDRKY